MAFQTIPRSGPANLRVAVVAPVDEFFASILSERGRLFATALAFVALMVPIVFFIGSLLSRSLRSLAQRPTGSRFQPAVAPPVRSMIREIDDLSHSVSTMRTLVETFSNFVPKRLVQQLVETGNAMTLGGARREVTVLFTDVVNFTGITENKDPAQVMLYTSRYFAAMSDAIMANKGTVEQSIGDAVMGYGTRRSRTRAMLPRPAPGSLPGFQGQPRTQHPASSSARDCRSTTRGLASTSATSWSETSALPTWMTTWCSARSVNFSPPVSKD